MKKAFIILGLVSGVMIILTGVLTMTGVLGTVDDFPIHPIYEVDYNDYGYAEFGTDYYTYSVNNSAFAAHASNSTNNNIIEFSKWLQRFLGMFLIGIGLADLCGFGIALANNKQLQKTVAESPITNDNNTEGALQQESEE